MRSFKPVSDVQFLLACQAGLTEKSPDMKVHRAMLPALVALALAALFVQTRSQLPSSWGDSQATAGVAIAGNLDLVYDRPAQRANVNNDVFHALGPYLIVVIRGAAGINQWGHVPPEWDQGTGGLGKIYCSDFAIAAIGTARRYGLAEAFKEDTLCYRCRCRGQFSPLRHAVISALTAQHGNSSHRVFSILALVASYTGSMTAVYSRYLNRFSAKETFRMGNYSLIGYRGGNIALKFFDSGFYALISRMHMNNVHGSSIQGPN